MNPYNKYDETVRHERQLWWLHFEIFWLYAQTGEHFEIKWDNHFNAGYEQNMECGHEIVALLYTISDRIPMSSQRYLHRGLTSSNVVDSTNNRVWAGQVMILSAEANELCRVICGSHDKTDQIQGFTHGRKASLTSLEHRALTLVGKIQPNLHRLNEAVKTMDTLCLGGAVGCGHHDDRVVDIMRAQWGRPMNYEATRQAISRVHYFPMWAEIGNLMWQIKQLATDMRFYMSDLSVGVKAHTTLATSSSCMPRKRNPSLWERVIGVCQVIMANCDTLRRVDNFWLDRDLCHSSVERCLADETLALARYVVELSTRTLSATTINILSDDLVDNASPDVMDDMLNRGGSWREAHEFLAGKRSIRA